MKFSVALHPKPELVRLDTSLRYTDILFGFVIREIFLRLQNWQELNRAVVLQLSVSVALVLGSWIGYRRSLNRSSYEVKFFNLPFFRFLVDQAMLIMYFRVATLTPQDVAVANALNPIQLAQTTVELLVYIFFLYLVWDVLGIWMAMSKNELENPRYPEVDKATSTMTTRWQDPDWYGLGITAFVLASLSLLCVLAGSVLANKTSSTFGVIIFLLVLYRFIKEVKTSWRQLR